MTTTLHTHAAHRAALPARSNRERGFTLIELLTTLVVSSILLAMALPSFREFVQIQRGKATSYDLVNSLLFARSEAIKRNNDVALTANASGWVNGWAVNTVPAGDVALVNHAAMDGIEIANTATSLIYTGSGRLKAGVTPFQIKGGARTRCVRLDLSGMPVVTPGACS